MLSIAQIKDSCNENAESRVFEHKTRKTFRIAINEYECVYEYVNDDAMRASTNDWSIFVPARSAI